jgi:hypothetical protein
MPASGAMVLAPDFVSVAMTQALLWRGNDSFFAHDANKCVAGLANLLNLVEQCNF